MKTVQQKLVYVPLMCSVLSTVNGQCSGSVQTLSVGYSAISVSPPGYPHGYATNLACSWLVTSSISGSTILFRVTDMNLNCAGDAINVYNGTSTNGNQIHTNQCSTTILGYQEAASGNVYSTFTSDSDNSSPNLEKGYKMYLISGKDFAGSGCSGAKQSLTASTVEQYLSSPGFPSEYELNKNCTWTIMASKIEAHIFLQLKFIDVEYHASCSYDYLEIKESETTVAKLCQNDRWEPTETYTSSGSSFSVRFYSDDITQKRGFLLSFIEIDILFPHSNNDASVLSSSKSNNNEKAVGEITAKTVGGTISSLIVICFVIVMYVKIKKSSAVSVSVSNDHSSVGIDK